MSFIRTTAISRLLRLKKRIRVIPGGTSAGKTYGILPILIDRAAKTAGLEISVVSESIPHLRRGALKDFLKIMKDTGRYIDENYNKTLLTYTFANGSYIEFFSADQESKVRGPRRNILYVNECNNITFATYHQLAIRTSAEIWLDFNPSHEFWVHEELAADPRTEWLTLTYKDNEALAESIVEEIEAAREKAKTSAYWANWWKVYGLGQLGSLEGVIYSDWETIPALPRGARLVGYGVDFGYSNDPTAVVALYEHEGRRIYDLVLYETGLLPRDIARRLDEAGIPKTVRGYADPSRPDTIAELSRLYGFNIRKANNAINFGIDKVASRRFYVTADSLDLIKELRGYVWDTDKTGKALNVPVDYLNHALDALRYGEVGVSPKSSGGGTRKGIPKPRHRVRRG